ncbi:hypothetical protein G3A43_07955 [Paraburkholderia aspalathi]|nr:hypothetical protein [Paraburkholderia aspalathi]MBK3780189.1 hypothetical protein [Paraburkholderia aspalathi]
MKLEVITYERMVHRLSTVQRLLSELSARGVTAQLVHSSEDTARTLQYALAAQAISTHTLAYTSVEADCIVLVDGDIIDQRTVARLEALDKDVYVIVPQEALPRGATATLRELREQAELYPFLGADDEYPRTFACNHNAETCMNCEQMVVRWKAERRDKDALEVGIQTPTRT